MTKDGLKQPNYFGSLTQAATLRLGNYKGEEVFTPFKSLLPMVKPEDIVFGGWDISSHNLADAMERAQVCAPCLPAGSSADTYGSDRVLYSAGLLPDLSRTHLTCSCQWSATIKLP